MASVNKVVLVGNCGRDPDVRHTSSGSVVCTLSVATTLRRKDKATGESIDDTQWHRVTFYDRLAEIARDYLRKGRPVYVEGRLKYGKYTAKDGIERTTVEIIVTEMQLLGSRDAAEHDVSAPASRLAADGRIPASSRHDPETSRPWLDEEPPF